MHANPFRRRTLLAGLAVLTAATLTACGSGAPTESSSSSASAGASEGFPVTVTAANGEVTLDQQPTKIVVLGPSLTETVYAVGAGEQVAAVDDGSSFPAEAPREELSAFQPNAEAVSAYDPDLVLITDDANDLVKSLGTLKIPVLQLSAPKDLAGAYEQIVTVGKATGHQGEAEKVAGDVQQRVEAAVATASTAAKGKSVYHELDPTFYSLTSSTFIGDVYAKFGLTNIADEAAGAAEAGGYPQLSAEFITTAQPDLIVLADTKCCGQSRDSLSQRPGFAEVPAVKNGTVLAADDDIASRWGPRIADFAESVGAETAKLK